MRVISKLALATGGALVLSLGATVMVQAQETTTPAPTPVPAPSEKTPSERAKEARERAKQLQAEAKKRVEDARAKSKETRETRLTENKLRICKNREAGVNRLMNRMSSRGEKQAAMIDKTLERVQAYTTDKNLAVAGYDSLLADANAKKAAVLAAVEAVKNGQAEFKCDGTDPKGAASVFKELMAKQTEAIKAYRASVIALLKAVKQSQSGTAPAPAPAPAPTPAPATPPAANTEGDN